MFIIWSSFSVSANVDLNENVNNLSFPAQYHRILCSKVILCFLCVVWLCCIVLIPFQCFVVAVLCYVVRCIAFRGVVLHLIVALQKAGGT